MRRLLRLPAVAVLLLSVAAGVLATTWLLDVRGLNAGGSVTEGVVTFSSEWGATRWSSASTCATAAPCSPAPWWSRC